MERRPNATISWETQTDRSHEENDGQLNTVTFALV